MAFTIAQMCRNLNTIPGLCCSANMAECTPRQTENEIIS